MVGSAPRGAKVAVIQRRQNWIQIRIPAAAAGKPPVEGWIHKSRLREDAPAPRTATE